MQDEFDAPSRRVATVGGGSPSYRVGPKGLKIIEELAARGCSLITIARALRMSKDAFLACRRRQPECDQAIDRGRAVEHDKLVGVLHDQAMAGQYVPAMFLLKARHGYREGDTFEANVNVSVNAGGVILLPNRQSMEDFLLEQNAEETLETRKNDIEIEHKPSERQARAERGD